MGVVYLVRHGQASFGAEDYDVLSPHGARQSEVAGEELRSRAGTFAQVASGTMRRQRDTATAAGLAPTEDARWNEYDHRDVLANHATVDGEDMSDPDGVARVLDRALRDWVAAPQYPAVQSPAAQSVAAETWPEFGARIDEAFDELVAGLDKGEAAVAVTSGGVIAALVARLLGAETSGFLALYRVTCNAGITTVATGRSGTTLVSFNEHGHLDRAALRTYR